MSDVSNALRVPHPDWLQVEVSALCNAACSYCTLNCYKNAWEGGFMKEEIFDRIAPEFSRANLVFLQGWGEPLLHPRFWEMARRTTAAGAQVGFTTNGTHLDRGDLEKLLSTPIDIVALSIAGTRAATSDRWRAGNDFARLGGVLEELKYMKRAHGTERPRVHIHIAYMLLASNWRDLNRLPMLAYRWGATQVVVNNLSFIGSPAVEKESLFERPDLWQPVCKALDRAKCHATAVDIELGYYRPDRKPHAVCTENVLHSCFVSYRGDVSPCVLTNFSLQKEAALDHRFRGCTFPIERLAFGNVHTQNLSEIWQSAQAREFRAVFERRLQQPPDDNELPGPCRHCYKLFEA